MESISCKKTRNRKSKAFNQRHSNTWKSFFYFRLKESLPPHPIPIPTLAFTLIFDRDRVGTRPQTGPQINYRATWTICQTRAAPHGIREDWHEMSRNNLLELLDPLFARPLLIQLPRTLVPWCSTFLEMVTSTQSSTLTSGWTFMISWQWWFID